MSGETDKDSIWDMIDKDHTLNHMLNEIDKERLQNKIELEQLRNEVKTLKETIYGLTRVDLSKEHYNAVVAQIVEEYKQKIDDFKSLEEKELAVKPTGYARDEHLQYSYHHHFVSPELGKTYQEVEDYGFTKNAVGCIEQISVLASFIKYAFPEAIVVGKGVGDTAIELLSNYLGLQLEYRRSQADKDN